MTERFATIWAGLSTRQKTGGAVLLAALLIALVSVLRGGTKTEFAPIYTGLSQGDAGAIVEKLKTAKVPYRLAAGGTSVEVPQDKVCELRLTLAQEGLPEKSQTGFELFDKSALPGTEFSNNVNYQRALQGELARTISSLQEISSARVHLVLPKASLFEDKEQASASIVLDTKPQAQLSAAQVRGIVHLVSSAVENLKPDNVTVMTTRGEFLAGAESQSDAGQLSLAQLDTQRQFEEQLRRRLQSMLDTSVGADKSVVRVRASLDFGSEQSDSETITPANGKQGLVSKENLSEEQYAGGRPNVGGVAGVAGNLNPRAALSSSQQGTYTSRTQQREYQYSRNVTRAKKSPGAVKQIMVAAVVDDSVSNVSNEQLASLLSAAAGADTTRGDRVVVERMSMASKQVADTEAKTAQVADDAARRDKLIRGFFPWAALLVLAMAGFAGFAWYRRRAQEPTTPEMPPEEEPIPMLPPPDEVPEELLRADASWLLPDIDVETAHVTQLEDYLRRAAETQPEAIALQIKALLEAEQ